jgi:hypothetical protein
MTWSYSGDPSTSEKDAIRFYIGDIDDSLQVLSDEDIKFLIDTWGPKYKSTILTAAVAAEMIANHFAREVSVSADGVSVGSNELQSKYNLLAENLRDLYKIEEQGSPIIPGLLWDGTYDPSITPLRFGVGFMDNWEAGRQDYGDYDPSGYPNYGGGVPDKPLVEVDEEDLSRGGQ